MASSTARTAGFSGIKFFLRSSSRESQRHLSWKFSNKNCASLSVASIDSIGRSHDRAITSSTKTMRQPVPVFARWFSTSSDSSASTKIRLSKFLSQSNTNLSISRRQAERLIRDGQVTVAGTTVTSPSYQLLVGDTTAVKVSNRHVVEYKAASTNTDASTKVWVVHKLAGEIVTENDPHGRPSMLERLKRGGVGRNKNNKFHHLKSVGRLDMSTEGLILVTNSGQYARQLELPSNQVHRVYRVRVHGTLTPHKLKRIRNGISVENMRYRGMQVQLEASNTRSTNTWLRMTCTEGKNRQIRKVLTHLGLRVLRLIRISYGDYQLQTIPPGMALEVPFKPLGHQRRQGTMDYSEKRRGTKHGKTNDRVGAAAKENAARAQQTVQWIRHS